jgi:hypothetical protein
LGPVSKARREFRFRGPKGPWDLGSKGDSRTGSSGPALVYTSSPCDRSPPAAD